VPESPEVQALAEFVAARAVGRTISAVDVVLARTLKGGDAADLIGCRIVAVVRRGKLLDLALAGASGAERHLVVHWGHDGWLIWRDVAPEGTTRAGSAALVARVRLDDGSGFDLTDVGQWLGLSWFAVARPDDVPAVAKLGPDPVDPAFTRDDLGRIVGGRRKQLKALLQDQTALGGIGNAYSDEILHAAKLSPVVHASTLSAEEVDRLFEAVRSILRQAMDDRRGLPPDALKDDKRANMRVHRRPGDPCPVCGDTIAEFTFSGAAAHYCPTCQTDGTLLP
jgi:formamidopyrimidine-DNA glycosylase